MKPLRFLQITVALLAIAVVLFGLRYFLGVQPPVALTIPVYFVGLAVMFWAIIKTRTPAPYGDTLGFAVWTLYATLMSLVNSDWGWGDVLFFVFWVVLLAWNALFVVQATKLLDLPKDRTVGLDVLDIVPVRRGSQRGGL